MTVLEFAEAQNLEIVVLSDGGRGITGGYCGDLLSWVMGRAADGDAWITVMGNVNTVAVAVLSDVSCIVLADDSVLDEDARDRAERQGINILRSKEPTFQIATELSRLLGV